MRFENIMVFIILLLMALCVIRVITKAQCDVVPEVRINTGTNIIIMSNVPVNMGRNIILIERQVFIFAPDVLVMSNNGGIFWTSVFSLLIINYHRRFIMKRRRIIKDDTQLRRIAAMHTVSVHAKNIRPCASKKSLRECIVDGVLFFNCDTESVQNTTLCVKL